MAITRIKVSNFKSFDELELGLRSLNVVVGANAAGKSNFLEIFRFLRDLAEHGPENAVSLQGGMEYLANLKRGPGSISRIDLELIEKRSFRRSADSELKLHHTGIQVGGERDVSIAGALASGIRIFDFDPGLPKRAMPLSGKVELETDGSNLALILRRLLQDEQRALAFLRLLRDALPFVEDLKIEHSADKSLLIALRERYGAGYIPAAFLSEGTIHLIAVILALFFEKGDIVIIEEPERNIHPALISKVAGMLKDASRHKQVIVTTHNPELVKHVDLEDLLLVHRDEEGFSRITRPAESAELKVFLENDLGVDELYVQNLLGAGNAG